MDATLLRLSTALDGPRPDELPDLVLYAEVITTAWSMLGTEEREGLAELFRDRLARIAAGEDVEDSGGRPLSVTADLTQHVAWMAEGLTDRAVADRLRPLAAGPGKVHHRSSNRQLAS